MALRTIVLQGDRCLTKACRPVTAFNGRLHQLLDDMAETLADANGAGLAAPQVGILRRVCLVLDEKTESYLELINPEIIKTEGKQSGLEGCLSVPGRQGLVDGDPVGQGAFLHRGVGDLISVPGLIRLGQHAADLVPGGNEGFQRHRRKVRRAHEKDPHSSPRSARYCWISSSVRK